jgi:hypothetical protein
LYAMRTAVMKPLVEGTSVPPAYRLMSGVEAMADGALPSPPGNALAALVGSSVTASPLAATAPRVITALLSTRFSVPSTTTSTALRPTADPLPAAGARGA